MKRLPRIQHHETPAASSNRVSSTQVCCRRLLQGPPRRPQRPRIPRERLHRQERGPLQRRASGGRKAAGGQRCSCSPRRVCMIGPGGARRPSGHPRAAMRPHPPRRRPSASAVPYVGTNLFAGPAAPVTSRASLEGQLISKPRGSCGVVEALGVDRERARQHRHVHRAEAVVGRVL